MNITVTPELHFKALNDMIEASEDSQVVLNGCFGQRYIGAGLGDKEIVIHGTPGNALGAYLNGASIKVYGNGQDATGDTMNDGSIEIHGNSGDATGYAMRGGCIYVQGDAGYRAGIHMKAYQDKLPVLVIGGRAGSFLGEYQAGGIIIVLGIGCEGKAPAGHFTCTGMHGGKVYLRCSEMPAGLPSQVDIAPATAEDLADIDPYLEEFCSRFGQDKAELLKESFYVLTPDTKNPYQQLYTYN